MEIFKSCKAVIYDCDGVMFDSLAANTAFYSSIFNQMGESLDCSDHEVMRIIHTFANRDVLRHFFPQRFDEALEHAIAFDYMTLLPKMTMESELEETLGFLKGKYSLSVCTNRAASMEELLRRFDLADYFDFVMTAAKASFPKPHPDPLLRVLQHFSIEPDEAVFVGDSEVDSMAASAAGVPFIAYKADLQCIARINSHGELLKLLSA